MNKILKNTLILTMITLIAGLALGVVYEITKDPIAQVQEKSKKEAWQAVFPEADLNDFEETEVDQKAADQAIADMGVNATIDEVCTVGDIKRRYRHIIVHSIYLHNRTKSKFITICISDIRYFCNSSFLFFIILQKLIVFLIYTIKIHIYPP